MPKEIIQIMIASREDVSKEIQRLVFFTGSSNVPESFDLNIFNNSCDNMAISEVKELIKLHAPDE
jgi:hypothetical protein